MDRPQQDNTTEGDEKPLPMRKPAPGTPETKKQRDPFVRAATEDDDGYDPWSDRKAPNLIWEEDPWR